MEGICKEMEHHYERNKIKDLFCKIKQRTPDFKPQISTIQDEKRQFITENNKFLKRWQKYCKSLFEDQPKELFQSQLNADDRKPDILSSEVEFALKKLKLRKFAGIDGIIAEMIKSDDANMIDLMHTLCNKIWKSGNWRPRDWAISIFIPIYKKKAKNAMLELSNDIFNLTFKQNNAPYNS